MIDGQGVKGNGWETILSSALQNFNGKINVLVKVTPKQPPEGDVSGMGPTGKQGVKLDQGKCVPPPPRIKCTCQRPDPINEKRRLDGVNFDLRN